MEERGRRRAALAAVLFLLLGLLAETAGVYQAAFSQEAVPALAAGARWLESPARTLLQPFARHPPRPLPQGPDSGAGRQADAGLQGGTGQQADTAVLLAVENILQLPAMPNGCEVTSLAMVLQALGYDATNILLAESYMPQGWLYEYRGVYYASDPAYYYIGDPASSYGYYMLAPALVQTANAYLADRGGACVAVDVSGAGEDELEAMLAAGTPVIVWATMDYGNARYGTPWVLESTGEIYLPYANLHCQVLVGADEDYFYINNPLLEGAAQAVPRADFMYGYRALDCQAVVVARRSHVPERVQISMEP